MDQLIQFSYVSSAIPLFTQQQLLDLLEVARKANFEHRITGLLLYRDGNFVQVIEGMQQEIEQLISNLMQDQRHTGIIQIFKEPILNRDFPDWSMGFENISGKEIEGVSNFLSATAKDQLSPGMAKSLLLSFKK